MDLPVNRFKAALREGRHQLGIWNTIGGNTVPEMLMGAGFDWILLDTEHSLVEVTDMVAPLQAAGGYPEISPVLRPAWNDPVLIKRYLDMGAQTLMLPYIQNRAEAEAAVRAMRFPPEGMRGVAGLTRASRWGKVANYQAVAAQELCLIAQVETVEAMDQLEDIAGVEGVDAVFIGPSDLSASMGYPGQANHPEVVAAILDGFARLNAVGVPGGILAVNEDTARKCIAAGSAFTAIAVDAGLLARAVSDLRTLFRDVSP